MSATEIWGLVSANRHLLKTVAKKSELALAKQKKLMEKLESSTAEELGKEAWMKKMNAIHLILLEIQDNSATCTDHLLQHNKIPVLVNDMVLVAIWRKQILPQLLELESVTKVPDSVKDKLFQLYCGGIGSTVLTHEANCTRILSDLLDRPAAIHQLATTEGGEIFDIIDHAVGVLKDFIGQKPSKDPCGDATQTEGARTQLHCETACVFAFLCAKNLLRIVQQLDQLPKPVILKLLHVDTELIKTLMDIIFEKPFCWSKLYRGSVAPSLEWKFISTIEQDGVELGKDRGILPLAPFHPLEVAAWQILHKILLEREKKEEAEALPRKMLGRLLHVVDNRRYLGALPGAAEIKRLIVREQEMQKLATSASASASPLLLVSPLHKTIGAELEEKKKDLIRMYEEEGTFNFEESITLDKLNLMLKYLVKDMNQCCFRCGAPEATLKCDGCRYAHYCDRDCRTDDEEEHKAQCLLASKGLSMDFGPKFDRQPDGSIRITALISKV